MKFRKLTGIVAVIAAFLIVGTAAAAVINPATRTVTTPKIFADWDGPDPERLADVRWNGSGNLTATGSNSNCRTDPEIEYFGNSWVTQDEGTPSFVFKTLVGWGSHGSWTKVNNQTVRIRSISENCYGSAGVPVVTRYKFKDHGPKADSFKVRRRFHFGATPFEYDFRPYIPRLSPRSEYSQVLHPNAGGGALLTEDSLVCDFGCEVTDWDGSWFAIHNPRTGSGMIYRRLSRHREATLWVDTDSSSNTAASSVLLKQPTGGFTGRVVERARLCFYDRTLWTPSLTLPDSCR